MIKDPVESYFERLIVGGTDDVDHFFRNEAKEKISLYMRQRISRQTMATMLFALALEYGMAERIHWNYLGLAKKGNEDG